jgi:hypothetical protein
LSFQFSGYRGKFFIPRPQSLEKRTRKCRLGSRSRIVLDDAHQLVGVLHFQRTKGDGIHQAQERRAGADAPRKQNRHPEGERRRS